MTADGLTRHFVLLRALRWLPLGLVLPFLVITPEARGLSLGEIGAVFAVHSAVAIALEVPSGALADPVGRRRVLLAGATLTAVSLRSSRWPRTPRLHGLGGLLAAGRALISGSLEAWYVDSLQAARPLRSADAAGSPVARRRRGSRWRSARCRRRPRHPRRPGACRRGVLGLRRRRARGRARRGGIPNRGRAARRRAPRARSGQPRRADGARARGGFPDRPSELTGSVAVRVVVVTGVALGMSFTRWSCSGSRGSRIC